MSLQPIDTSQLRDLRSPEFSRITYLKDLDLTRRDYSVKVRVLRLWKQPMYNNHADFYSIEMILVDEEGTRMQANVLKRWFPRFEHILKESECYFFVKPTIGRHESKYKYVDTPNKIGIYCDSSVYLCNDFNGPTYGFSFTTFDPIIDQTIPEDTSLDVIGFVSDVGDLKIIKTHKGNNTKKVNVLIQDLNMKRIFLSLWDTYADEIMDVWAKKDESGFVVVILQFGTLKYYQNSGFVNNAFSVSKLFINSPIEEIIDFQKRLLQNAAISTCSSDSSKLSGLYLSLYDDFVVKTEFNNIAEINLSQEKSVVIVGTIQLIPQDIEWYYLACKKCNFKLKKIEEPEVCIEDGVDQLESYECKNQGCNQPSQDGLKRLKIPLTVQDSSGTVSLTLFDRQASKLLKKPSAEIIEKHLSAGDDTLYPEEFSVLLQKKFAFKIDIKEFNVKNKFWVFGVAKLTDNPDIISELEKKANNYEGTKSDSITNTISDIPSQETVNLADGNESINNSVSDIPSQHTLNLKVTVESSAENVTPLNDGVTDNEKGHVGQEATFKRKSKKPDFKRKLVDSFDVEENAASSATKPITNGKKGLLIPKTEK